MDRAPLAGAGVLLVLLALSCTPAWPPSAGLPLPDLPVAGPAPLARLEADVHARVNAYRAQRGLPPLRHDERLVELARRHSEAMAQGRRRFGHDGFDERAAEAGRHFAVRSMAENVAYDNAPDPASAVVQGWIRSPGHHANIVGGFEVTGVGAARGAGGVFYLTQLFVAQR